MPLPLLIVSIIATTGYGVKKGLDAKKDFDEAKELNKKAQEIYEKAQTKLESKKEDTNTALEFLGKIKVNIYEGSLKEFVDIFSQINNIDFKDNLQLGLLPNLDEQDMLDIKDTVVKMEEILGGGIAALGSGALAGIGALGGVSAFATASTGTAIASLSGAAATNATLAWLGGGSLAAGGFGMAGGMVVLGGLVTGPMLAVGGFIAAKKAEEAKYTAKENYSKAKIAKEEIDAICTVLDGIFRQADEFSYILEKMDKYLIRQNNKIKGIIKDKGNNYLKYSTKEKKQLMIAFSIAETIKNLCDTPIIDEKGEITKESKKALEKAKEINRKIKEI